MKESNSRAINLESEKKELLEALNRKNQNIQALEESHCNTKIEVEKLKEENITNTGKIDSMLEQKENSEEKLKKIRHRMVAKTFLIDPNNENLDTLQTLEIENIFLKYEQGMMVKDSFKEKYEETIETLSEVKTKLKLKSEKNDLLEEKLNEIMDKLNIPGKVF